LKDPLERGASLLPDCYKTFYEDPFYSPKMSVAYAKINSMLGKRNEARRKAEAKALFSSMLKAPHLVEQPNKYKGTRQSQKRKAINDSL
jgi:hypothetical protein